MIFVYLALFVMSPILSMLTSILGMVFSAKRYKVYLFCFCMSLGLIAYNLLPIVEYDLYRYYEIMAEMQQVPFLDAISNIFSNLDPLSYLTMYGVSATGNYRLLQFISVSIGYWFLLRLLLDIFKVRKYRWYINLFFLAVFLCSFEFVQLYSGFRNSLAIGIFLTLLYRDTIKHKSTNVLLYIIPALFHSSMAIPALVLMLIKTNGKIWKKVLIVAIPALTLGLQVIKEFVHAHTNIYLLELIDDKLKWYDIDYTAMFHNDYYMFKVVILIIASLIFYAITRKQIIMNKRERQLSMFIKIMIYLAFCMIFNLTFFTRYSTFVYLAIFYYYLMYMDLLRVRQQIFIGIAFVGIGLTTLYAQYVYISILTINTAWLQFLTSTLWSIF